MLSKSFLHNQTDLQMDIILEFSKKKKNYKCIEKLKKNV